MNPNDKPYDFVLFPDGSPERRSGDGHYRFDAERLSGVLKLDLVAHRPVQVASGFLDVLRMKGQDVVVAREVTVRGSVRVIPGSSLKGAVRSLVEALSPSCVRVTGWRSRSAAPRRLNPCSRVDALCPACRLFGMSGRGRENYAGQVGCEDAVMVDGKIVLVRVPLLWAPARGRRGLPARYLEGREAKGRKFYFHGKPARGPDARIAAGTGSVFRARFHFANLTDGEMGLLLVALGQHPEYPFLLKIGAAKPVGLGSVEVRVRRITFLGDLRRSGRAGGGEVLESPELREKMRQWMEAAASENLLNREALEEVWSILRQETLTRTAPEGPY